MANSTMTQLAKHTQAAINFMSTPAVYFKAGTAGRPMRVGWKRVAPTDIELVNAYGIGAIKVTIAANAIAPDEPAQFDRLELLGELYTIDYVGPNYSADLLVSYLCYCTGQKQ